MNFYERQNRITRAHAPDMANLEIFLLLAAAIDNVILADNTNEISRRQFRLRHKQIYIYSISGNEIIIG